MDEREKEIRERLANATPGPWLSFALPGGHTHIIGEVTDEGGVDIIRIEEEAQYGQEPRQYDVDLIANAPADLEYLLAELGWTRGSRT